MVNWWWLYGLLGVGSLAFAADQQPLVKVGVMDFPPFYEVVSHRPVRGVMLAPIDKLMREAGLRYRIDGYPAKRLYRNLASGESHFFIGIKGVPEYEGKVYLSPSPVNIIRLQLYRLPTTRPLATLPELAGKDLIVIRGYRYAGLLNKLQTLQPAIVLHPANDHKQALMMLKAGRGDYLLDYSLAVDYTQRSLEEPITMEVLMIKELPLFLLVSKKAPDAEALMARLNRALEQLLARGELDILKSYNPRSVPATKSQ